MERNKVTKFAFVLVVILLVRIDVANTAVSRINFIKLFIISRFELTKVIHVFFFGFQSNLKNKFSDEYETI